MTLSTVVAPADGAAASDDFAPAASSPPGVGAGRTAGTRAARAGNRWLTAQGRPGRRFFLAAGLADLAATAGTVIMSWYIAALIVAGVVGTTAGHGLAGDVLGVAAGGFLRAAGGFAADRLAAAGAGRAEASARDAVLDVLVLGDPADEQISAGLAVAAVSEQLPRLGDHFHDYQRRAVTAGLAPAVILAVIFPASWVVGVLLVLATPIVPVNMVVTGLGAEAVSRRQMHQVAQLSGQVLERLQAMSTLRALGAIGHQRRLVERAAAELAHRTVAVLRVAFLASSALEWVSTFAIGLVAMYVGATLLGYVRAPLLPLHLGAQAGVFVLLLAPAYFAPLRRFAAAYHQRQEALAAAEILAPLTRRSVAERSPVPASSSAPAVALHGVTVRFAGRPRPALSEVSVLVPPRTVLGVAGPSGSGKSTLLKVAGGWLRPSEGLVLIDGAPAAGDSGSARALLIGQHPYLFSGTLADNIALGQPGASRSRIWAAIEAAQLTRLLGRLPDGLDTVLGERGWSISGGEAQRVALARAFLSDAGFVLVDEPTAHLDAATEAALIEPLTRLLRDLVAGVTLVEQDSQLLSGTVADNLRLARPDATADELRAAMEVAVLAGQVDLTSQLGPGGEGLSGGQRRRLAVAQAYLRHPGLLLLDEPTEGLDHDTARALLENLRSALPGTTIIAAIHDRTLDHLAVPADAAVRLAAGRVLRVTYG